MSESFKDVLEVIRKDWAKLSNFAKFCFSIIAISIATMFAIDASVAIFERSYQFWLGILVAVLLIILCIYWLFVEIKVFFYRLRFPIKKMGSNYSFKRIEGHNAVLIIYGKKDEKNKKKARWIENGRTMFDLGFEPYYRKFTDGEIKSKEDIEEFKLKRGLRTRRPPDVEI